MKQGWERKNLGDVFKLEYGKGLDKKFRSEDGFYPIYGANGIKGRTNKYYYDSETIIVGRKGSAGEITLTEEKFWPLDVTYFLTFDKNKYNLRFIYHLLRLLQLQKLAKGVKPGINRNDVYNIQAEFPPLEEQKRIVAILDKTFAAIDQAKANAKQNLKNSKELFESYLQSVFENKGDDWEGKKLNEIGNVQTGTTPKTAEKENYGNYIPFIKPADVDFSGVGDIRYDNEGLSKIGLKKGREIDRDSILMVCIGATIGKVGFAEQIVSCNQQINTLTVKKDYEPKFFYYAMTSRAFQDKVLLEGKGAQATLPIINKTKWANLNIRFPKSKNEQQKFVNKLNALSTETKKLESIYHKKIKELEELKKSVLQKAFSGEL